MRLNTMFEMLKRGLVCGCQLEQPVRCVGNVEVWLGELLVQQMKALHTIIRQASQLINDPEFQLLDFINESIAQVASRLQALTQRVFVHSHNFVHNRHPNL